MSKGELFLYESKTARALWFLEIRELQALKIVGGVEVSVPLLVCKGVNKAFLLTLIARSLREQRRRGEVASI